MQRQHEAGAHMHYWPGRDAGNSTLRFSPSALHLSVASNPEGEVQFQAWP